MDQNQSHSCLLCGGKTAKALLTLTVILSVFVAAKAIKELKSIPYVGKDVAAMNTISVSGKGEVYAVPDVATFTFTIQEESLLVNQAQTAVNKQIADALAFLKKSGVAEKDIKTLGYNIYPRYEYRNPASPVYYQYSPEGTRTLAGYVVSQSIQVKVRNIAESGTLVSGVGELGATDISGLQFSVDDDDELLRTARKQAIDDAQEKAQELARDLGVRLVRIVSFSDGGSYPPVPYYAKADVAMGRGGAVESAAELPPGENQFISNVNITYEIR